MQVIVLRIEIQGLQMKKKIEKTLQGIMILSQWYREEPSEKSVIMDWAKKSSKVYKYILKIKVIG